LRVYISYYYGSFGDGTLDTIGSVTWANNSKKGGSGWGDEDKGSTNSNKSSSSTSKVPAIKAGNNNGDMSGGVPSNFFQEGDDNLSSGLTSVMNGPPGLSSPKLELDQMKTVEELEAEQKAAAAKSTSSTSNNANNSSASTKPSAPPGMSEPQAQNNQGEKNMNQNHHNNHEQYNNNNNKPNHKQKGRRNNNNQHNMDKNMVGMMHGYGGGMYGYMDPAMYGNMYAPNMMMGNMSHLQQPIPTGPDGPSGGMRSNLVDEGVNNGSSSPNSASRPTLGYGGMTHMQGYMGGFTGPPQNAYFYGGGYAPGYMVPPGYPQHNVRVFEFEFLILILKKKSMLYLWGGRISTSPIFLSLPNSTCMQIVFPFV
jgi:hypothetical protein